MKDLISIVVPIYKVEKYLNRCVDSILKQTYQNLEIILVDDGSPDGCGKICDEYSKLDDRIKVIHKQNGGLSDARNVGLSISKGKYISFIDSDDIISPIYIETLYDMCIDYSCDISMCFFQQFEKGISFNTSYKEGIQIFSNIDMIKNLYNDMYVQSVVAQNKLYKVSLFENIKFPFGMINEDEATTYKLFYIANKIAVTRQLLYGYYYRSDSITKTDFSIKNLDFIKIAKERTEFFKSNNEPELYAHFLNIYCYNLISFYNRVRNQLKDKKDIEEELIKEYNIQYKYAVNSIFLSKKQKLGFILLRIYPGLFDLISKLNRIIK